ncbi:MAG: glycine zipper 2TM domain-containing protein [Cellvibrionaceae bacterium]
MNKTFIKSTCLCIAFSGLALVNTVYAGDRYGAHNKNIEFAKVTNVSPIYETVSYKEPQRECHYEDRTVRRKGSNTSVIIGSIIGGAIGNELGHNKSNKKVGTVVGAVLGGSIANDISKNKRGYDTVSERICTTTHHVSYEERVTGYNVAYKYRGNTYYTTTNEHPGKRIRVAVTVRPLVD